MTRESMYQETMTNVNKDDLTKHQNTWSKMWQNKVRDFNIHLVTDITKIEKISKNMEDMNNTINQSRPNIWNAQPNSKMYSPWNTHGIFSKGRPNDGP